MAELADLEAVLDGLEEAEARLGQPQVYGSIVAVWPDQDPIVLVLGDPSDVERLRALLARGITAQPARLLDQREVARRLGVGEPTLARWRQIGDGPPWKRVGRLVRYDARDLEAWLETR